MPRYQICSAPGCCSRSDREKFNGVKFHRLPQDPVMRHKWLVSIKKPIIVSENTRICSLHFEGSKRTIDCPLPTIFAWSVPVKHRQPPAIRNPIPCKKQKNEEPPSPSETAREEIERHEEQIAWLQADVLRLEEVQILLSQRFCLKRFEGSDLDIQFYTGLPSYPVFMCLYRYLEPLLCHLRLCRSGIKSTSTQTDKPRARALQPIDELFLVLIRLRLGLLEQDLAHQFNIGIATVSRICITWIKFLDQQLRHHMALKSSYRCTYASTV